MATIPATLPTTTITTGGSDTITLSGVMTGSTTRFRIDGTLPPRVTASPNGISATSIGGTPRVAGDYTITLTGRDDAGDMTEQVEELTIALRVPDAENIVAESEHVQLPMGVPVALIVGNLRTGSTVGFRDWQGVPAGLAPKFAAFDATYLHGTVDEPGTHTVTANGTDSMGNPTSDTIALTVEVIDPSAPVTIPAPAAERTEDGYMLPDVEGVIWTVDDVEQLPGSYSVEPVTEATTVTILPVPDEGYLFDPPAELLVLVFEPAPDPDPDPDPEPAPDPAPGPFDPVPAPDEPTEDEEAAWQRMMDDDPQALFVATRLAERIVRHAGRDLETLEPAEVLTARDHAAAVAEYVHGYVRGRGFAGHIPHRSLQAVIVSAGARLFVNPEQLSYYSTGDYSERPATLTGWTSAELSVLRRFRRTYR